MRRLMRHLRDLSALITFFGDPNVGMSLQEKVGLVKQLYMINSAIPCIHTQEEALRYIKTILQLRRNKNNIVVEAGCYKGGSTAKFSLAADMVGAELVVFDSFQGVPNNCEPHEKNIFGGPARFKGGDLYGSLDEVKLNVSRFGRIKCCTFIAGWFDNTMSKFKEPISAIYLDVVLASSTRTCLQYLYPLLNPAVCCIRKMVTFL